MTPRLLPMTPLLMMAIVACSPSKEPTGDSAAAPIDWSAPGPWGVGTMGSELTVNGRTVAVRTWYPSDDTGTAALETLVQDAEDASALADLLDAAPAGCPARESAAVADAPAGDTTSPPLVAFSHCHTCLGLSGATIAAHLASYGVVVVAPDHTGNTLFDLLEGDGGELNEDTLAMRAADIEASIDAALSGDVLPVGVAVDADKIGVMGHSFGSVTAGRVLSEDPRVQSAMAIAAPVDNPLLQGADAEALTEPVLMVLLEEDNSIGVLGNTVIENNFEALGGPGWLARVPDAGHWSVSDLCGVVDGFMPGCGDDERQSGGAPFSYIPADDGRASIAAVAAAFFAHTLEGDADAGAWLADPETPAAVNVTVR
jgi:predicted dienelactone hydrolase